MLLLGSFVLGAVAGGLGFPLLDLRLGLQIYLGHRRLSFCGVAPWAIGAWVSVLPGCGMVSKIGTRLLDC